MTPHALSAIVRLLERAQSDKPRLVLADRVAQWFLLIVLVVAGYRRLGLAATRPIAAFWIVVAPAGRHLPCALPHWPRRPLTAATAPCTKLGIADPWPRTEGLNQIDTLVLDKPAL